MCLKRFNKLGTYTFWFLAGLYASSRYCSQPWVPASLGFPKQLIRFTTFGGPGTLARSPLTIYGHYLGKERQVAMQLATKQQRYCDVLWNVICSSPLRLKFRAYLKMFSPATFCAWFLVKRSSDAAPGSLHSPEGHWLPSSSSTSTSTSTGLHGAQGDGPRHVSFQVR